MYVYIHIHIHTHITIYPTYIVVYPPRRRLKKDVLDGAADEGAQGHELACDAARGVTVALLVSTTRIVNNY